MPTIKLSELEREMALYRHKVDEVVDYPDKAKVHAALKRFDHDLKMWFEIRGITLLTED